MSDGLRLEDLGIIEALKKAYAPDGGDLREHNADRDGLGFGLLHYALVRNLKPDHALALGSRYGFVPACIALALQANRKGRLHFVDANYDDRTDCFRTAYGGTGYWTKPGAELFSTLNLHQWIDVFVERTDSFFPRTTTQYAYVYIDANHSYDGVKHDFEHAVQRLAPGGVITFHDALVDVSCGDTLPDPGAFGVKRFLQEHLREAIVIERWPGLAIVQPKRPFLASRSANEISQVRQQLAEQFDEIQALKNQVRSLESLRANLDNSLRQLHERLAQHDAYYELIARVRNLVNEIVPKQSTVFVVSKGDDHMVCFEHQRGRHFPEDETGVYAGEHPENCTAAVTRLENLHSKSARYLLFPQTAFWWFDSYPEFKAHLDRNYRLLANEQDTAVIYSLDEQAKPPTPSSLT